MNKVIETKLIQLIREIYRDSYGQFPVEPLTLETDVQKDLHFDSILLVVLQIQIEDEFQIRFDAAHDDLRYTFSKIGRIIDYIQQHVGV